MKNDLDSTPERIRRYLQIIAWRNADVPVTYIARKLKISRARVYAILDNPPKFKPTPEQAERAERQNHG